MFEFNVLVTDTGTNRVQRSFALLVNPVASPVPAITALSPRSIMQGSDDTTVTITGTGFVPASIATWNGANLSTEYVSATQIKAVVPKANLVTSGQTPMGVKNPAPGGGPSNTINFTVIAVTPNPSPTLTSMSPSSALPGAPDTQITITGTGFIASTKAVIGVQQLSTVFVSATQLEAIIPASYLASASTHQIQVNTPAPGGGTSAALTFTVGSVNPLPTITALSPSQATAGGPQFTLTLTGTSFVTGGQATFAGTALATTVVSATSATAIVPASLIATAGDKQVTFVNPTPGGGASNNQVFLVLAPSTAPVVSSISPNQARVGSNALSVNVWSNGGHFLHGATVYASGTALGTVWVNTYSLYATIPASMLTTTGTLSITARNPGSADSNALTFTKQSSAVPIPTITSVTPSTVVLGNVTQATAITITGTNFVNGGQQANTSAVYWRFPGEPSSAHIGTIMNYTTVVNTSTQITLTLPPGAVFDTAGDHFISVANPAAGSGGGQSNEAVFLVQGANPVPDVASIAPAGPFGAGTGDVELTLAGAAPGPRFVSRTEVTATGAAFGTRFIGRCGAYANTCKVTVPASLMTQAGDLTITATSPAPPGGGAGATATLSIVAGNPTPQLAKQFAVSPAALTQNKPGGQVVTLSGSGFTAATTVKEVMSNTPLTITSQTNVSLQVNVPPALIDGTYPNLRFEITNPAPGGGTATSADVPVQIRPQITGVTPSPVPTNQAFTLTVTGYNLDLAGTAQIHFDGPNYGVYPVTNRTATQWTVDLPATAFTNAGWQNFWLTVDGLESNHIELQSQ